MVGLADITEPITLALILASAALFVIMAFRSRSLRSLQVQFSVAMLVWAGSEVPHILGTLGFIDIQANYEDMGLGFHFLSMFVLAGFIALRTSQILGEASLTERVEKAAYEGLRGALGESGAAAARFYVDLSMARKQPTEFVNGLRKLFSAGSEALEQRIAEALVSSGIVVSGQGEAGKGLVQLLLEAQGSSQQ